MANSSNSNLKQMLLKSANTKKTTAKKHAPKVFQYSKNLASSMGSYSVDYFVKSMSSVKEFSELNASFAKEIGTFVKNPTGAMKTQVNRVMTEEVKTKLGAFSKFALEDIKSGKIYDRNRFRTSEDNDNSFGGFDLDDWDNYDGFDDDDTEISGDTEKLIESDMEIARAQEDSANNRAKMTVQAMGEATGVIVDTQRNISHHQLKVGMVQHGQLMEGFNTLVGINSTMIEAQAAHFGQLNQAIAESTNHLSSKFDELIEVVKMGSGNVTRDQDEKYDSKSIFRGNTLDAKKYFKHVIGKGMEKSGGNMLSGMLGMVDPSQLLDLYMGNPIEFMANLSITKLLPKYLKSTMERVNESFSNVLQNFLLKLSTDGKNKGGLRGAIGRIFGYEVEETASIDSTAFKTGRYAPKTFTENLLVRMDKYISEVIPMYLRTIATALTGKSQRVLDYKTGRFVDPKDEISRISRGLNDMTGDMSTASNQVRSALSKTRMTSGNRKNIEEDTRKLLQHYAENNLLLNPHDKMPEELDGLIDKSSWNFIMGSLKALPRNKMQKASAEVMSARNRMNGRKAGISKDLAESGLLSLFSDYSEEFNDIYSHAASGGKREKTKFDYATANFADLRGVNATNKLLYDIRALLTKGIIVYPLGNKGGSGDMKNNALKRMSDYDEDEYKRIYSDYEKSRDRDMVGDQDGYEFDKDMDQDAFAEYLIKQNKSNEYDNGTNKKGKKRLGYGNRYRDMPFKFMNAGLNILDKTMYKMIYGHDPNDKDNSERSLVDTFLTMIEATTKKVTDYINNKLFGPDGVITKGKNKVLDKYVHPYIKKGKEFLVGDEGLFRPTINSVKGELKSMTGVSGLKGLKGSLKFGREWQQAGFGMDSDLNMAEKASYQLSKGISSITSTISSVFLGDDFTDENGEKQETRSKKLWKDITGEFKGFMPKAIAGGMLGVGAWAGSGLLTGLFLPGGPILAGLLGSSASFISHSEKFREYVFGKDSGVDKDGNVIEGKKGLLDKEIVDGFKKFAPKVALGAGLGSLMSKFGIMGMGFLPAGPIMGGLLGSIAGMTLASDQMRELLFGKKGDETGDDGLFSKNTRKKIVEALGIGAGGAAAGFIAGTAANSIGIFGLSLLPGGPILGAIGGITAALNHDRIKRFFFGDQADELDDDGKKTGKKKNDRTGLFAKGFDTVKDKMFEPFIKGINTRGEKVKNWFQVSIVNSFSDSLKGLRDATSESKPHISDAFKNIGTSIKESLNDVFKESFGNDLKTLFKEKVLKPLTDRVTKIVDAFGRFLGNILAFPFKALNAGIQRNKLNKDKNADREDKRQARIAQWENTKTTAIAWAGRFHAALGEIGIGFNTSARLPKVSDTDAMTNQVNSVDEDGNPLPKKSWFGSMKDRVGAYVDKFNDRVLTAKAGMDLANSEKQEQRKVERAEKDANTLAYKTEREANRVKADKEKKEKKDRLEAAREENDDLKERNSKLEADGKMDSKDGKTRSNFVNTKGFKRNITGINNTLRDIRSEIKGQLNGVGWNLEYIRNILMSKFGKDSKIPEPSGERIDSNRPKGKLAKVMGWFKKKGRGIGDGISDAASGAVEFVKGIPFLAPLFGLARGVKNVAKGAWGLGGDLKDAAFGLGAIIKESLVVGLKSVGITVSAISSVIKESVTDITSGIGIAFKETMVGLGGFLKEMTIGLGAIFAGGAKSFGMLLPELMGLGIGGVKLTGKLIGKGVGLLASPLYNKVKEWAKQSAGASDWFNTKTHVMGTVGIDSIALGPSAADKLAPVHLLNGMLVSIPPIAALPVYIAGGNFRGAGNDIDITNINGMPGVGSGKGSMSPEELKAKYGLIGYSFEMFRRRFRRDNDYGKTINNMIGNVDTPEGAIAASNVMQAESLETLKAIAGVGGTGDPKKDNKLGGFGSILKGLSFLLPLVGSIAMALSGQTERAVIDGMKFMKKIFPKKAEALWGFVKKKTGKAASGIANVAKKGISRLVNGKLIGEVSQEASQELIKRLAIKGGAELSDDAIRYGRKKLSSILAETGSRQGMKVATKFTANLAKESIKNGGQSAVLVAQNAAKNMKGNGIIKKIVEGIRKIVTNSKVLNILGGSKMISGIDKFFVSLSSHLATKTLTSSIIAKIFAKMSLSIAFITYDVTTGMAEAANILQVRSEDVTAKMRVASGLAKMISGLLMIVPDTFIGPMIYKCIANEKEEEKYKIEQEALYSEYEKYTDQGGDKSFDAWNEKVANKRVSRKVIEGIGGAFKSVGNFFTGGKKGKTSTMTQSNIGNVSSLNLESSTASSSANTNSIAILIKGILDVLTGGKVDVNLINKANGLITGSGGTGIGTLGKTSTAGIFTSGSVYGAGNMDLLNTTQFDPANVNNIPSNQGSIKNLVSQSYTTNPITSNSVGTVLNTSAGNIMKNLGSSKYKKNERIDRVMQYYQYDPRWAEQGMSAQQATTACGPIVAAMLLSSYLGKQVNPAEMNSLAKVNGFQDGKGATNINFFDFLSTKYDVKFYFGMPNKTTWMKQLKENKPMVIMGKGDGGNAKTPFNEVMHFMIVSSYSANDDKFFVIDPFTYASGYYKFEDFAYNIKGMRYTSDKYGNGIAEASVQKAVDNVYSDKHALNTSTYETGVESEGAAPGEAMDLYGLIDAFGDVLTNSVSKFFGFDVANYESTDAANSAAAAAAMSKYPIGSNASMYAGKWLTGDADMRDFLGGRLEALAKANNNKININSGRRTYAEQLAIYNKTRSQNPGLSESELQNLAATPGRSKHELGLAADVGGWAQNLTNEQLAPYGLYKPLSGEPWHVEPLELKGIGFEGAANKYGRLPETYSANANDKDGNYASGMGSPSSRTIAAVKNASGASQLAEQSKKIQDVIANVSAKSNDPVLRLLVELTQQQVKLLEVIADNTANTKVVTTGGNSSNNTSAPVVRSVKQDFAKVISK